MINKSLLIAVCTLLCAPLNARTSDGLIIGGFAGLTAGLITSAIAHHANHTHCNRHSLYVEEPQHIVERPVIVEQVIEHRPVVIEQRVRHRRINTFQQVQPVVVPQKAFSVETQTTAIPHLAERELALREQQIKLDLLKEENKKQELKIKELELELQRLKDRKTL
jgi:hypothetical protein